MQNSLKCFPFLLIAILLLSTGCSASDKKTEGSNEAQSTKTESQTKAMADKLIVYCFHTEYRCWSCNQFEKLTKEVIEESYSDQVEKKQIEFKSINIETDENKHYVEDYKLVTKSVVLSLQKGNNQVDWKNMDKIWTLVRDSEKFKSYIKSGISDYMEKVKKS